MRRFAASRTRGIRSPVRGSSSARVGLSQTSRPLSLPTPQPMRRRESSFEVRSELPASNASCPSSEFASASFSLEVHPVLESRSTTYVVLSPRWAGLSGLHGVRMKSKRPSSDGWLLPPGRARPHRDERERPCHSALEHVPTVQCIGARTEGSPWTCVSLREVRSLAPRLVRGPPQGFGSRAPLELRVDRRRPPPGEKRRGCSGPTRRAPLRQVERKRVPDP